MGLPARQSSTNPIEQVGIALFPVKNPCNPPISIGLRRSLFIAGVLAAIALGAAPAAHARPAREIAGVAVHPWQLQNSETRERVFDGVAATGARWVRVDMPWSWVEKHGPTLRHGHGNWSGIDPIVRAADQRGLKLLPIVGFTPEWASDTGELWTYPDPEPFEEFFAAALRRYPQIPAWELWNEPNFYRFSKPSVNPAGFVEFLRSARRARDSVGSRAKLISGGIAPGGDIDMVSWINQIAARGALRLIDGLGVHPYSAAEPDDPRSWMMGLQALHDQLADLGRPDLPLWITEFGAPTVPVANGYAPALTEAQQADRLRSAFALAGRFDWIENLTWYEYRDGCDDRRDPECNFGLVHGDLSRKPSYDALRSVIAGATAKLHPRLLLSTKIRQARVPAAQASKRASKRPSAKRSKRHLSKRQLAKRRRAKRRAQKRRAQKRIINRVTLSGRLTLPGTQWPNAVITVLLPRRGGAPPKAVPCARQGGLLLGALRGPRPCRGDAPGPLRRLGGVPPAHRSGPRRELGHHDLVAEVELLELEQVPVAALPLAAVEVGREPLDAVRDLVGVEQAEHGDPRTHARVEVRARPAPVGVQEAVAAVVRNRDRLQPAATEGLQHPIERVARRHHAREAGQVVAHQPRRAHAARVPGEHHHPPPRNAAQLGEAALVIVPVVVGQHRHRGVEGVVVEREPLGARVHDGRRPGRPLGAHDRRRLHRGDVEVGRLVRPRPGADVEHRAGVAEGGADARREARVLTADVGIADAEGVVAWRDRAIVPS